MIPAGTKTQTNRQESEFNSMVCRAAWTEESFKKNASRKTPKQNTKSKNSATTVKETKVQSNSRNLFILSLPTFLFVHRTASFVFLR